jgi:ribosomal small subunit protein bTHX
MGKGDKKTMRGKIWRRSYGNKRPHSDKTPDKKTK